MDIEEIPETKTEVFLHDERVCLLPFFPEFVEKYHRWMQDPVILLETGSDEMSLEEIREIQEKYLASKNDHCFIIYFDPDHTHAFEDIRLGKVAREQLAAHIVGDVNLFTTRDGNVEINVGFAMTQIMIGEKEFRRKGLASNALSLTHSFIKDTLKKPLIQAKINKDNTPSIEFFKKFGYQVVKEIKPFDQLELHLRF